MMAAVKAAMGVAGDIAERRLDPAALGARVAQEARVAFGRVVGPEDPLWELHGEISRSFLAAGGIPADELAEWLAVARAREPVEAVAAMVCTDDDMRALLGVPAALPSPVVDVSQS